MLQQDLTGFLQPVHGADRGLDRLLSCMVGISHARDDTHEYPRYTFRRIFVFAKSLLRACDKQIAGVGPRRPEPFVPAGRAASACSSRLCPRWARRRRSPLHGPSARDDSRSRRHRAYGPIFLPKPRANACRDGCRAPPDGIGRNNTAARQTPSGSDERNKGRYGLRTMSQ